MDCRNCGHQLADSKDIFFFTRSKTEVHLVIKPECRAVLEVKAFVRVQESRKKVRIKCKKCLENAGTEQPYGPDGTSFLAFATEKISFFGKKLSGKKKWSEMMTRYPYVDRRDMNNFFGTKLEPDAESTESGTRENREKEPIRFASCLQDFEWCSLTARKIPRNYQIEAYIEALQRDLVVVIDTGLGKTLIATLVIARMKVLNPDRMGVMLVDRIPLVFQQGHAIMNDTRLRVCCVCSENRTSKRVKQFHDGTFDVLVITAGSFLEMVNREAIEVSDFSVIVFDECHHATGDHVYTNVLQNIDICPREKRPRILGLTASPFKVENFVKGKNQLAKFRKRFLDAAFFYPDIPRAKDDALEVKVFQSDLQKVFIENVMKIIRETVSKVNAIVGGFGTQGAIYEPQLYHLKGQMKALGDEYPESNDLKALVNDAILLIDVIEICALLGVSHAVDVLKQAIDLPLYIQVLMEKYSGCTGTSPRLCELEKLLKECTAQTRAIVFVRTQISAHRLLDHLGITFPDMNPRLVVGRGGYFGMAWDDEQKPVLREFREGETNLLVATSVLEEGLDVADCDLVVRYAGPNTLTSFIQSRGRARKQDSKFFVFTDEHQAKSTRDLEDQEQIMRYLIKIEGSKDCLPSVRSRKIKEKLCRGEDHGKEVLIPRNVSEEGEDKRVIVIEFYVRTGSEELGVKDALIFEIEQYDIFTVHRIFPIEEGAGVASGTYNVFTSADKAFLTSLCSEADSAEHAYESFCRHWDFELTSLANRKNIAYGWCRHISKKPAITEVKKKWLPLCVEFGKFVSNQTFECAKTICKDSLIDEEDSDYSIDALEFLPNRSITINVTLAMVALNTSITIPLTEIQSFSIISVEMEKLFLYIPLKSVPFATYLDKEGKEKRLYTGSLARTISENTVVCVTFESNSWIDLCNTLSLPEIMPVSVFNTRVKREFAYDLEYRLQKTEAMLEGIPSAHDSLWLLKGLRARHDICVPNRALLFLCEELFQATVDLTTGLYEIALNQILQNDSSYWIDLPSMFTMIIENLKLLPTSAIKLVETPVPSNHVMIKRVVITPTRQICLPATPVATSRMLRYYGEKYDVLIVRFREEQFQKLQGTEILPRIRNFIEKGFKIVKHYLFFCASASQLRDHKAYFIAATSYLEVEELRKRIIKNRYEQTSTAKYLSRLGLFCTSDKPAIILQRNRMLLQEDIKAFNGDLVTDGCGKISKTLAKEISSSLGHEGALPAAYQIRLGGIKGVLMVAHDNDPKMCHADVIYRESMLKFENDDETLCVVSSATYNRLFLNREVITLLTSINESLPASTAGNWMIESAIAELHEKAICDAAKIFEDSTTATDALAGYMPKQFVKQVSKSGFDLLCEPFWFSLLQSAYRQSVIDIRGKSRIPVQDGCLLMGVADPTGELKDDEVFLQIQEDAAKPVRVITGIVLIYRNPCLHPGDLRWVRAVDSPSLRPWRNVVMLPTKDVRNSLAADCSGGDLDGDRFAVIWDWRFIPPINSLRNEPLNYAELAQNSPKDFDPQKEASLFADLFGKIIANLTLGRVANMHVALCDRLKIGACDELAKELAKSQSQAVDFPKTGIVPLVPEKALSIVSEAGYPDFMEKDQKTYVSEKLLGVLYRRCRSMMFDFELAADKGQRLTFDLDLIIDGYEDYMDDALEKFDAYKKALKGIMVHYSLKREAEVVLGKPLCWNPLRKADKGSTMKAIAGSYEALVRKYREEFFKNIANHAEVRKKASAWYHLSYDQKRSRMGSTQVYSFAWVVHDVLCTIKSERKQTEIRRPNAINTCIGESIFADFHASRLRLESIIATKENVLRCIKAEIERVAGKECFAVEAYGSVSMYLCDEESDLDICLTPLEMAWKRWPPNDIREFQRLEPQVQARHFLEVIVSRAIDNISNSKEHRLSARVPLITIGVGDSDSEVKVDLSFNKIGLLKTRCMHRLYNDHCYAFPLFWILVRWARLVGMIKSGSDIKQNQGDENQIDGARGMPTGGVIAAAEFYALVIHLLELKPVERKQQEKERKAKKVCSLQKLIKQIRKASQSDKRQVAEMLITFFRRGSTLGGQLELIWPWKDVPPELLTPEATKLIVVYCMNGLHCILATRDVRSMLSYVRDASERETSFSKKLPKSLVLAIGKASHFHAARLASVTGAKVQISLPIVYASGRRSAIIRLKEELQDLSLTNRALMLGRLPKKTSRYFMEGSSLVIMRRNASADAMVKALRVLFRGRSFFKQLVPKQIWLGKKVPYKSLAKYCDHEQSLTNVHQYP